MCNPKYDDDKKKYYCYFELKNNYNESNLKFAISSINRNEYFIINTTKIYNDKSIYNESNEFIYIYNGTNEDIDFYKFKFEFSNNETKNKICGFFDRVENIYPQIYSVQMFLIDNFTKTNHFNIKNKYSLIYLSSIQRDLFTYKIS